jgi:hypothetical protein
MPSIPQIFAEMPGRYRVGAVQAPRSYYFSIGDHKYTVKLTSQACVVEAGKTLANADCVLKTTPDLFERMVINGELPGALDIARGRFKTNDPSKLRDLRGLFRTV